MLREIKEIIKSSYREGAFPAEQAPPTASGTPPATLNMAVALVQ